MERILSWPALVGLIMMLTACSIAKPVRIGDTEAEVLTARGTPTHRYQTGAEKLLEYNQGPWGQHTYMARIGPDGKLVSFEQVLTDHRFGDIKINEANKTDVLHRVGTPADRSYLQLSKLEVWSYPYKESGVWNSIMHVHFDQSGIVRKMVKGPDLRFDPDRGNLFGLFGR